VSLSERKAEVRISVAYRRFLAGLGPMPVAKLQPSLTDPSPPFDLRHPERAAANPKAVTCADADGKPKPYREWFSIVHRYRLSLPPLDMGQSHVI